MATKLDASWEKLFKKYSIKEEIETNGFYRITADQIREFREPRLMTKFDNGDDLPSLFKENHYSIMPISRSEYYMSRNEMFFEIQETNYEVESFPLPNYIESIKENTITSEAIALNCSYLSGMIEDFVEDELVMPTVSGKMSSKKFTYRMKNVVTKKFDTIDVNNSMIEIDGAYEGKKYLTIIEAKQTLCDNFLIRQLYYPYRVWKNRVSKDIKLIYFVYSNDILHFFEYRFDEDDNYNSLNLVRQKNYTLQDLTITTADIEEILYSVTIVEEPEVPFPQADSFNRIVNMCECMIKIDYDKTDLTDIYAFTGRQTDYYSNAGKYLGLLDNEKTIVGTTNVAREIFGLNFKERQLKFVELILKHSVFNDAMKIRLETRNILNKTDVVQIMKEHRLFKVNSEETYKRRASTVISWIEWIIGLIQG